MKTRTFFASTLAGALSLAAAPARAYWIGNPGLGIQEDSSALEFVYDFGEREVEPKEGGDAVDLESRRLYIQWRKGLGTSFQLTGRLLPGLGRLDLEDGDFNPSLWGGGVALQFSPREKIGPVRVGINAAYDLNVGETGGNDVTWAEGSVGIGASYDPSRNSRVYGGLSIIKPDIEFEVNGVETEWEAESTWGPFLGANLLFEEHWILSFEAHFVNEQVFGVNARYRF